MLFELYPLRLSRARTTALIFINATRFLETVDFSAVYALATPKKHPPL